MLNFVILDDNEKILNQLQHNLESIFIKYDFDAKIGLKATHSDTLFQYLECNKIDVLILDINLNSDLNGIQIANQIRKGNKDCYFIFETAHLEYSLLAYQCKTFDFLCKPINFKKLENTILRLFEDISGVSKKFIKINNKNVIIAENEIKFLYKEGMKLIFHTNCKNYEVYSSFAKIKDNLPENFIRCHKSFIANINNITKVEFSENTVFFDSSFCDIGPKYKSEFMEAINKYGNIKEYKA